jgi:hypothetical protein
MSRSAKNLKLTLGGNEDSYLYTPDLCRTGLAQQKGLTRSQCGQIKTTSRRLLRSERHWITELIQARK